MNLIWTKTLPRRLIDQDSGRDVTGQVALVYPFTDEDTQSEELGQVTIATRNGQTVKRILRNPGAPTVAELAKRPAPAQTKAAPNIVVATKSAPVKSVAAAPRAKPKVAAKRVTRAPKATAQRTARYVQVGMFGVPSNAQATAKRLLRMGLPVRIGKLTRKGKTFQLVMAGPFGSDKTASQALSAVRKAGFADAYLRK